MGHHCLISRNWTPRRREGHRLCRKWGSMELEHPHVCSHWVERRREGEAGREGDRKLTLSQAARGAARVVGWRAEAEVLVLHPCVEWPAQIPWAFSSTEHRTADAPRSYIDYTSRSPALNPAQPPAFLTLCKVCSSHACYSGCQNLHYGLSICNHLCPRVTVPEEVLELWPFLQR